MNNLMLIFSHTLVHVLQMVSSSFGKCLIMAVDNALRIPGNPAQQLFSHRKSPPLIPLLLVCSYL